MSRRPPSQQEESIYNLIPQPTTASSRPSLYRSKYPHDTPPTASTFGKSTASTSLTTNLSGDYELKPGTHRHRQAGGTFGPKNLHYADPTNFQPAQAQPDLPQRQETQETRSNQRETKQPDAADASRRRCVISSCLLTDHASLLFLHVFLLQPLASSTRTARRRLSRLVTLRPVMSPSRGPPPPPSR